MVKRPDIHRGAAFFALIVTALALLAAPAAFGAKPTRTVITPGPQFFPAGLVCAFAVAEEADPDATVTITEFGDGRTVFIGHAFVKLTNVDTGDSVDWRTRIKSTRRYDPGTNDIFFEDSGRFVAFLFPGDAGPDGEVGANGALLGIIGHTQVTLDLDIGIITSFSLDGAAVDLCAPLSS